MILFWMAAAFVLTQSYRSVLLSMLIPIRYEPAIDTMAGADASGQPIYMVKGSAPLALLRMDRRPHHRNVAQRAKVFSRAAEFPEDILNE